MVNEVSDLRLRRGRGGAVERKNVSARAGRGDTAYRIYDAKGETRPPAVAVLRSGPLVINLRSRKGGWNIISTKRLQTHADTCTH